MSTCDLAYKDSILLVVANYSRYLAMHNTHHILLLSDNANHKKLMLNLKTDVGIEICNRKYENKTI